MPAVVLEFIYGMTDPARRKHEKRHSRPYGCTFSRCNKRFGSRNDWKRHEEKQHFIHEQWRCRLPAAGGGACGKLCGNRESMSDHLHNNHGNEGYHRDSPVHWDAIDASNIGGVRHPRFWCGFCNDHVSRGKTVYHSKVDARFQHIGDHYDKNKMTIDDWVDIEEGKQRRFIASSRRNNQDDEASSGEMSDLAGSGITEPTATVFQGGRTGIRRNARAMQQDIDDDAEGESDHEYAQQNFWAA